MRAERGRWRKRKKEVWMRGFQGQLCSSLGGGERIAGSRYSTSPERSLPKIIPKETALQALNTIIQLHFKKTLEKKKSYRPPKEGALEALSALLHLPLSRLPRSDLVPTLLVSPLLGPITLLSLAHLIFMSLSFIPFLRCINGFKYSAVVVEARVPGVRTGCPDAPSDGFVSHGPSSPYRRLIEIVVGDAAVRDRGGGTWAMAGCCDNVQDLLTSVNDLGKRIRMAYVSRPDAFVEVVRIFHFSFRLENVCKQGSCFVWPIGDAPEKSVDKLSVKEFRERFCIPNGVLVEFLDEEEVVSTEKAEGRAITFSKEQFNAGFGSSPSAVQRIPSFYPDPSLHPPKYSPGADGMQHSKHGRSTLTLAAGGGEGVCGGPGCLGGAIGASGEAFFSKLLIGSDKRGHVVEWVEKASFVRLNKLFEITVAERQYVTLLTARNLMAVVRESEVQQADAEKCRALLVDRGEGRRRALWKAPAKKRSASSPPAGSKKKKKKTSNKGKEVKLPTPPKEFVIPPITYEKEVTIKEPENPFRPLFRVAPDMRGRLCRCVTSYGDPNGGNGAESQSLPSVGPSLPALLPVKGSASRRSSSARNLKSGLIGRLQDRFPGNHRSQLLVSVQDDHPEGSETEMATETPAVPMVVPDEVGREAETDSTGSTTAMPSAKMFEVVETLVSGLRGMVQQHDYSLTCCGPLIT
ncbi:hypothetical protein CK203_098776 [Vitis vinifera]|uniref:Uncharacterized protein n=1 Tax=Vitis vinifera TaxID=29760 RepID=A0A438CUS9_VITVI|nr:hypothetical protein CK203_098776 [Vitis vinifera]